MNDIYFRGEHFPSLKELHAKHAKAGVTYAAFYARYRSGIDIEVALSNSVLPQDRRTFSVDGVLYNNLKDLAAAAGIDYRRAYKRFSRGWPDSEIFHGRPKKTKTIIVPSIRGTPIEIDGVIYANLAAAYNSIKPPVSLNTVKQRLRVYHWTAKQALGLESRVDGRSIRTERPSHRPAKTLISAFGITYPDIAALAKAHGISYHLVYNRLKYGWTAEKAVTEAIGQSVDVNGKTYKSALNAWEQLGKTTLFVFNSRRQAGHDLMICLGLAPLRDQSHQIDGKTYPSLLAVAEAYGIKESVLASRLNRMSISEAARYAPSNGRYSSKRFKEEPELAHSIGWLYFVEINFPTGALHKVGITQRTVEARFLGQCEYRVLGAFRGELAKLFEVEQALIKEFKENSYRAEEEFEGRTETFILNKEEEQALISFIRRLLPNSESSVE
ncbi:MAG: hypothetical protein JNM99_12140 [Verrucomicrobiaceae bacterium]|nr:hypothetical protein [Verrucomicrobiaceae bacterium]